MSAPVEKYHHPISQRRDWETPPELFDRYDAQFGFSLDVCATPDNAKCARYFTPAESCRACGGGKIVPTGAELDRCPCCDGLTQSWSGRVCWMNPPYGREIRDWMRKAWEESQRGATVVALVPARTDSGWWHDYASRGEVEFLRGRVKFVGALYNAPFPCAVVVFRPAIAERAA